MHPCFAASSMGVALCASVSPAERSKSLLDNMRWRVIQAFDHRKGKHCSSTVPSGCATGSLSGRGAPDAHPHLGESFCPV
eukprot:3453133-Pyramimonas_sp.AAC.1